MIYRLLSHLPFPLLYFVSWLGYLLLYHVARYRREVVRQNLSRAFPEMDPPDLEELGKAFYRQLAQVALEVIKARRMTREDFQSRVKIRNPELLRQASNGMTESVIVMGIHQGNWEWVLHGATSNFGVPIDPVYKPLHNKTVDKLIYDIRSQFGSRPLPMDASTRDILRRRREFRIFVLLADQSPIRRERGYWTRLMNQEAKFYLGGEIIAKMTKFPVLFVQCHRCKPGYYEVEFHELARPPYDKESHAITDRYVELAEQAIRSEPQSWLWSNRRWKLGRTAEDETEAAEQEQAS